VPILDDVRTAEFPAADVVVGGFPCQDISDAGGRAGLAGERSGLWRELLRAIRLVRPLYAIVENVAALLGRGMGTVLETWPRSGMTRSGIAYQRAPLVPRTHVIVSGSWHTPMARDYRGYTNREGESICNQLRRLYGGTGRPNPRWIEWLMGYPVGWCSTNSTPSATPSSRKSRK
jgi:hypothetical protein